MNTKIINIAWKVFDFLTILSLSGAIIYRLFNLNIFFSILSFVLAILIFILINPKQKTKTKTEQTRKEQKNTAALLAILLYLISILSLFFLLFKHVTNIAIISPWEVLPQYFFILYFFAGLLLFYLIKKNNNENHSLLFVVLYFLLSFFIALIVYKINYGFDSLIHQATEKLIFQKGQVLPKPFYYLGQYSLVVILGRFKLLSLTLLDKLYLPLLSAIFLPLALYEFSDKLFPDKKNILLSLLLFLGLPFSFFIVSTPQNFSYLLFLLILLKGPLCHDKLCLIKMYIWALLALVTQAMAGIPALIFVLFLSIFFSDLKHRTKQILNILLFTFSTFPLALSFYLLENGFKLKNIFSFFIFLTHSLGSFVYNFKIKTSIVLPNNENIFLNFAQLYTENLKFILLLLILAGIFLAWKYRAHCRHFFIYFFLFLILILNYIFSSGLNFAFLINYEQKNYLQRLLVLSLMSLSPFMLLSFYWLIDKVQKQNKITKIIFGIFFALFLTASLYNSYPRFDNYKNSHGYSVGKSDIEAVRWINNNAKQNFIVLANQQTSVAALREFGFKKYYLGPEAEQIFYYPIPTGAPLYKYYMKMVYDYPSQKNIQEAMDLVNVSEAYFVINKYWWASDKIIREAKIEADSWKEINDGEIYIFKYLK